MPRLVCEEGACSSQSSRRVDFCYFHLFLLRFGRIPSGIAHRDRGSFLWPVRARGFSFFSFFLHPFPCSFFLFLFFLFAWVLFVFVFCLLVCLFARLFIHLFCSFPVLLFTWGFFSFFCICSKDPALIFCMCKLYSNTMLHLSPEFIY